MGEAIAFYSLATLILVFGVMVISARNPVHSVLFLVGNFLLIAILYLFLHAEFLAVIQVLLYAGGIVVLYLFVMMLINMKRGPEVYQDTARRDRLGIAIAGIVLAEFVAIALYTFVRPMPAAMGAAPPVPGATNVEQVAWLLYADYLVPFEVMSVLLLLAMVGAIVLARRDS
jgi:NADH-quinone oxidoreductase subunit J